MDYLNVLKDLSCRSAVSGMEKDLCAVIKGMFEKYCDSTEVDKFFNVIGIKKGYGNNKRKVMVTAHLDEIGFLAAGIDENGFIRISPVGGIDSKLLLAQEVIVHGKKDITGVIGAKPPHLMKPEESKKSLKIEDISVDTGLSPQKVKEIVSVGDIITLKAVPLALQGNKLSSKSLDNRCGVFALLGIMEEMKRTSHRYLYKGFSA